VAFFDAEGVDNLQTICILSLTQKTDRRICPIHLIAENYWFMTENGTVPD